MLAIADIRLLNNNTKANKEYALLDGIFRILSNAIKEDNLLLQYTYRFM
jgi:hypothetical protein